MKNNWNKILNELSYRVSSGIPDLTNEQHLIKLWDILKEHKWSVDARVELLKNISGRDTISEAVFSPRELGTKQKYQPMWISTIENGEEFTTESPNGSVVLDKSNLNMKGFDNGKTLRQVLTGGNKQDFENFFKKDGSFKPILKGKDGKLYGLNQISKQTYIGDIIINYNFINKPKSQNLKSFKKKLIKTFIHGFLHLLGFDHVNNKDYIKMCKEEEIIYQSVISKLK